MYGYSRQSQLVPRERNKKTGPRGTFSLFTLLWFEGDDHHRLIVVLGHLAAVAYQD